MAVNEIAGEDVDLAGLYADIILAEVPKRLRKTAEAELLSHAVEYRSEFALRYFNQGMEQGVAEGVTKGVAKGESAAVLAVLEARGVHVPEAEEVRILGCRDIRELDQWLARAATADSITDVLGG